MLVSRPALLAVQSSLSPSEKLKRRYPTRRSRARCIKAATVHPSEWVFANIRTSTGGGHQSEGYPRPRLSAVRANRTPLSCRKENAVVAVTPRRPITPPRAATVPHMVQTHPARRFCPWIIGSWAACWEPRRVFASAPACGARRNGVLIRWRATTLSVGLYQTSSRLPSCLCPRGP